MYQESLGNYQQTYYPAGVWGAAGNAAASWYVVYTACHHEFRVEQRLKRSGRETFLPWIAVPSRRCDRRLQINVPLFPGYLFIREQLTPVVYHEIVRLPGVARILRCNGGYATVCPEVIESIRQSLASLRPCGPHAFVQRGKQVRVVEGPLRGIVGIIKELKHRKRRLVITVELFKRSMAVELDDDAVEPY